MLAFIVAVPQLLVAVDPRATILVIGSRPVSALIEYVAVAGIVISVACSFRAKGPSSVDAHVSQTLSGEAR